MNNQSNIDIIDIKPYPEVREIVERCYVKNKHIYIELKKPKDIVIATIKGEYTTFRKEIERLLKQKGVDDKDANKILQVVDNSYKIIYKDNVQNNEQQNIHPINKDSFV